MAIKLPEAAKPLADFVVQVVIGAIVFILVLLVAVIVAGAIRGIAMLPFAPEWLVTAAEWAEQMLFGLDLFTFALFLLTEAFKLGRGLWKEITGG